MLTCDSLLARARANPSALGFTELCELAAGPSVDRRDRHATGNGVSMAATNYSLRVIWSDEDEGVSLNALVTALLAEGIGRRA